MIEREYDKSTGFLTIMAKYNKKTKKLINVIYLYLHPFLISAYPILFLFANSKSYFPISVVVKPLVVVWTTVLLLILVFWLFVRKIQKVTVLVSLFMFGFFSYGHALRISQFLVEPVIGLTPHGYKYGTLVLIFWLVLMSTISLLIIKRCDLNKVSRLFTRISILLVVFTIINIGGNSLNQRGNKDVYKNSTTGQWEENGKIIDNKNFPNIYYIILDGYGRSDVLKETYNYDNSIFLKNLEEKGFYVASKSSSNYIFTPLSLSSSLNFDYINNLLEIDENYDKYLPLYELIHNNKTTSLLKSYGYKFVVISSGYYGTEIKSADVYIPANLSLSQFDNGIISSTPIPLLLTLANVSTKINTLNIQRNSILKSFENLQTISSNGNPMFVFVHIMSPHPPFVFDAKGKKTSYLVTTGNLDAPRLIDEGGLRKEEYQKMYSQQVAYISKRMTETINAILSKPDDSVIIVQGDHGPRSLLDWDNLEVDAAKESFSILNLYYFPDGDYSNLYKSITPVNSFRVILNKLFDKNYELLDDRNYFSKDNQPYKLDDVTEKVN